MLSFLGAGAAYNFASNNNAAYFVKDDTLYLFDCGEKICDRMLSLDLLSGVRTVHAFITHLHSDHIGSLEPLLYYIHFFTDKKLFIYYPDRENLHLLLRLMGIDFDFEVLSDFAGNADVKVEYVPQQHIPGSYGYFVYSGDGSFFYSGDCSAVNQRAVAELKNGTIDRMYHEVTISLNSMIHTHLSALESEIPMELRHKVTLMHIANEATKAAGLAAGFEVAEEVQ